MRLTDLLDNLAPLSGDNAALAINGLAVNSAEVKQGDLFFALPGTARDGRDFIDDAITRGAVAILTDDRPLKPNKTRSVPVVQASNPRQV
ncbi:MAG: Mur ligase domain-containing protein, partial [Candidatus Puniceispirillaceae bacterium]